MDHEIKLVDELRRVNLMEFGGFAVTIEETEVFGFLSVVFLNVVSQDASQNSSKDSQSS